MHSSFITMAALATFFGFSTAASIPAYCYADKYDKTNNIRWIDVTEECRSKGVTGTGCCVTVMPSFTGTTPPLSDPANIDDLKYAMRTQVEQDGMFKSSKHGKWTCTFAFPTTAIRNRAIRDAWGEGLYRMGGYKQTLGSPVPQEAALADQLGAIPKDFRSDKVTFMGDWGALICQRSAW